MPFSFSVLASNHGKTIKNQIYGRALSRDPRGDDQEDLYLDDKDIKGLRPQTGIFNNTNDKKHELEEILHSGFNKVSITQVGNVLFFKASATKNLIITFPLAFPILESWNIIFLSNPHSRFSFPWLFPNLYLCIFFINLMASIIIDWSTLRIYCPKVLLGLYDSFARFLFSFAVRYYLIAYEATRLLWGFSCPSYPGVS